MKSPLPPPNVSKLRPHLARTTTLLVVFSLGYTLGLLSSSSSSSTSASTPHPPLQSISKQLQLITPKPITNNSTSSAILSPPLPPPPHDLFRFRDRCATPRQSSDITTTVLDNLFDGENPYTNFLSPETKALLHPPASRPRGWGSTGAVFHDLIESVRPDVIIELGAFLGASALHMAAVASNLSISPVILCIDDFRGWPGFHHKFHRYVPDVQSADALLLQQFMANVAAAGEDVKARVLPMPFSTASALAALCEWGLYGDLIEVDAGHDFHSAWADINAAWAVLRPGGVMFGHDYFTAADNRGVRRAVTLFAKVKGLSIRPHGEHWVLSPKPHGNER